LATPDSFPAFLTYSSIQTRASLPSTVGISASPSVRLVLNTANPTTRFESSTDFSGWAGTVNHQLASIYGNYAAALQARIISSMWRWCVPQQPPNTFGFRCVRDRQCGNEVSVALSERTNVLSVIRLCLPHSLLGRDHNIKVGSSPPSVRKVLPSSCGKRSRYFVIGFVSAWQTKSPFYITSTAKTSGRTRQTKAGALTLRTTAAWGDTEEHQNCQHG